MTESNSVGTAALEKLAAELDAQTYVARLVTPQGRRPYLHVRNRAAGVLTENDQRPADGAVMAITDDERAEHAALGDRSPPWRRWVGVNDRLDARVPDPIVKVQAAGTVSELEAPMRAGQATWR